MQDIYIYIYSNTHCQRKGTSVQQGCASRKAGNKSAMNTKKHSTQDFQVRLWTKSGYMILSENVKALATELVEYPPDWPLALRWPFLQSPSLGPQHALSPLTPPAHGDAPEQELPDPAAANAIWSQQPGLPRLEICLSSVYPVLVHVLYLRNFNVSFHCGDLWNVHVLLDWYRHDLEIERWRPMAINKCKKQQKMLRAFMTKNDANIELNHSPLKHLKIQDVSKLRDPGILKATTFEYWGIPNFASRPSKSPQNLGTLSTYSIWGTSTVLGKRQLSKLKYWALLANVCSLSSWKRRFPCMKRMLQWRELLSFVETYHHEPFVPVAPYGHLRCFPKTPTSNSCSRSPTESFAFVFPLWHGDGSGWECGHGNPHIPPEQ